MQKILYNLGITISLYYVFSHILDCRCIVFVVNLLGYTPCMHVICIYMFKEWNYILMENIITPIWYQSCKGFLSISLPNILTPTVSTYFCHQCPSLESKPSFCSFSTWINLIMICGGSCSKHIVLGSVCMVISMGHQNQRETKMKNGPPLILLSRCGYMEP